jgi:putative SOS response-associated peptidase YedK
MDMCLRYAFTTTGFKRLKERFGIEKMPDLKPRYNIAPTQQVPVIYDDSQEALSEARWGLESGWLDHPLFNARAETIDRKPSFRKDFEERRCLMLADSFYEWKQPEKQPFRVFLRSEEPFAFAGIHDSGGAGRTCAMITVASNELISRIHDRMPAILPLRHEKEYLEAEPEDAKAMLRPFPAQQMDMYAISDLVNKAANDSPALWKPKSDKGTLLQYMD